MAARKPWEVIYRDERYRWIWPPEYDPQNPPFQPDVIVKLLDACPPARVLDLACGQGWLTIPLALRGFEVTGSDLSEVMLARARTAAEAADAVIEWHRGDMRFLPEAWDSSFDFVTLTLSEFGCFEDDAENQAVLDGVARVLRPGGRFLIDLVTNRDGLAARGDTWSYLEGDGYLVAEDETIDLLSGLCKRNYHWYEDGRKYEWAWQIRAYAPSEVAVMLRKAGLNVVSVHADLGGAELTRTSVGMTFVVSR